MLYSIQSRWRMLWGSSSSSLSSGASSTITIQLSSKQLPDGGGMRSGAGSGKEWGRIERDGSEEKELSM